MINLKTFTEVFEKVIETQKYFDDVEKVSQIELFETPMHENYFTMFNAWMNLVIKDKFIDTVNAYLYPEDNWEWHSYDRPKHPLEIIYSDGAINRIGTIEQLYNYIKENDGFYTNC